ncbi:MAG: LptF/LptG family permease [Sphaerochaetaceae bacterium]
MIKRKSYTILYKYITKEYLMNFLLSFIFFFFIFFINQILLLAQKILIRNVSINVVFELVFLTIPKFLLYTIPFSCLAAASMLIGALSSQNEIMAMRFSGINIKNIILPIIVISIIFSGITLFISDYLIPLSSISYKVEYKKILKNLPTLEIDSFSINQINNFILSNGLVDNNVISDIIIINSENNNDQVLTSKKGSLELFDLNNYIYKLDLFEPQFLSNKRSDATSFNFADAEKTTIYLNFSNQIPSVQSTTPSQLSIRTLLDLIKERKIELKDKEDSLFNSISKLNSKKARMDNEFLNGSFSGDISEYLELNQQIKQLNKIKIIDFYLQSYKSEFFKKIALSLACICLVFIAFPISFTRIKYGRLVGFALSILVAVFYWFMLFYAQLISVRYAFNPIFFIFFPDLLFLLLGILLLWRLNKN